ncbi:MAG: tRNA (adenosine(37)-N6)-dimethylallyltransferase MiaA [Gemmatimonas sp.]
MTDYQVIIGPTAAGKSRIAMGLATARHLAIISADSRQIYRGFDIGTAKPSRPEQVTVPHFGIDVCAPQERFSAHAWASAAASWIAQADASGRRAAVVGGTGFYIRALISPLDTVPVLSMGERESLGTWLHGLEARELRRWCIRLDPQRATLGRVQQLRAVETALLSGHRLSASFTGSATRPQRTVRYLVVDPGAALAQRIASRVRSMVAEGWLAEIEALGAAVPDDAPAWKASGYAAMRDCLRGTLSETEAVNRVIVETRQYAKRQRTWCRHQLFDGAVSYLNPDRDDALDLALAWWDGSNLESS